MVAAMMTTSARSHGNKAANNAGRVMQQDNSAPGDAAAEDRAEAAVETAGGFEAASTSMEDEPWSGTFLPV